MNSTSFLRYISILTPKLLSFPSQRRNGIPRLLKEQVTATQEQDPFPSVPCLFPSVDVSGNYWEPWSIFIPKHDLLHSEVKKMSPHTMKNVKQLSLERRKNIPGGNRHLHKGYRIQGQHTKVDFVSLYTRNDFWKLALKK